MEGDKNLICKDCAAPFVLNAKELAWFIEKSMTEPKRCGPCRKKKRAEKEAQRR